MRIIGDVHGKLDEYKKIALASPDNASVQIGDMGFSYAGLDGLASEDSNHRFFRGNHDNYDITHELILPEYYGMHMNMFYLAGSVSIDALVRVQQYMNTGEKTWWYEEEIPQYLENIAFDGYKKYVERRQKTVVLSHDCPLVMKSYLRSFGRTYDLRKFGYNSSDVDCRTQKLLQKMYDHYEPDLWIFGHWHRNIEKVIGKTVFICLAELSHVDITVNNTDIYLNGAKL